MQLKHYLAARMVTVSAVCLAVFAVLALAQAAHNIRAEGQGARQLQQLIATLHDLQVVEAADLAPTLARIERFSQSNELRHVQFELQDAEGVVLFRSEPAYSTPTLGRIGEWLSRLNPRPPRDLQGVAWDLLRKDGLRWHASLKPNFVSEQEEAAQNLLSLLAMMAALTLALTVGAMLNLQRALRPITGTLEALARLGRQDYVARVPTSSIDEMQAVGRAVSELARSLEELEASRRSLSIKLLGLQEEERAHLARELHDELGQRLTVIRMNAGYLSRAATLDSESREAVGDIADATACIQQEVRDLLGRLRPQGMQHLDVDGFASLLRRLVQSWCAVPGTRLSIDLDMHLGSDSIDGDVLLAVYRITQEALTNVARHAHASRIGLHIGREEQTLVWQICDDGRGIGQIAAALESGSGLAGMRERIWSIGGTFDIESHAPHGTRLVARVPCAAAQSVNDH